jgi:hypothetical protein
MVTRPGNPDRGARRDLGHREQYAFLTAVALVALVALVATLSAVVIQRYRTTTCT